MAVEAAALHDEGAFVVHAAAVTAAVTGAVAQAQAAQGQVAGIADRENPGCLAAVDANHRLGVDVHCLYRHTAAVDGHGLVDRDFAGEIDDGPVAERDRATGADILHRSAQ